MMRESAVCRGRTRYAPETKDIAMLRNGSETSSTYQNQFHFLFFNILYQEFYYVELYRARIFIMKILNKNCVSDLVIRYDLIK
jgi:hypothetical protein